ncbi:MAG: DinB family protein [Blastocatellia bacterium]
MSEIELLIYQIEQAFHRRSWHGPNLLGSVRGLKPEEAVWRPRPGRHNIWEILVHAAYWKYTVYRKIAGESRGSFALKGSDWFERPIETTEAALKADIRMLKEYHERLIEAVSQLAPSRLEERPAGSKFTYRDLVMGVGAHDLYHAGQIQMIKRLRSGAIAAAR